MSIQHKKSNAEIVTGTYIILGYKKLSLSNVSCEDIYVYLLFVSLPYKHDLCCPPNWE